jgi:uncharacterized secreted protein with C-terminal beta-propeller domain
MRTPPWLRLTSLGTSVGAVTVALMACSSDHGGESVGSHRQKLASLYPIADCNGVEEAIRAKALAEMNRRIDASLESALSNGCGGYGRGEGDAMNAGASPSPAPATTPGTPATDTGSKGSSGGATEVSKTNNQIAGVDEADFIKNDNKYIYVVNGSTFQIVDAWPATQAHEIAKVSVAGTAKKLFVEGDRAIVYSSIPRGTGSSGSDRGGYPGYGASECTYGYDCDFTGDGTRTQVAVYDISDRTAPRVTRTIQLSGSYIGARRIGNAVHTVVASPEQSTWFEGVNYYVDLSNACAPGSYGAPTTVAEIRAVRAAHEAARAKNTEIIRNAAIQAFLPAMTDTASPAAATACSNFYGSGLQDGTSFTSLVTFDLANEAPASSTTILSRPGAIFASAEALYMAVPHQRTGYYDWFDDMAQEDEASTIHKFVLGPAATDTHYNGSGVTKGRVLNQFSMDEYEGNLRIATTKGHVPSPDVYSTLTVLSQGETGLEQVGQIDHIAPKEDIRSVRFAGPRGYIVTFKKTDPLFLLDLASATQPRILSELKIPGFSTYMHMMDDTHLLTIGYDANDHGDFAYFAGVILQIFDVSDPQNPKLAHKETIGTRGSSSEALANHLAFNYFAPKSLLALPMTICEGGGDGSFGTTMSFSGLMVYDTTAANGFHLRGRVAHPHTSTGGYDNGACSNWWTQASSEVKRSIFMDDYVFSISEKTIKANQLDHLDTDVSAISIAP